MGQDSHNPKDSSGSDGNIVAGNENDSTRENVCPVVLSQMEINDECQTSNISNEDKLHVYDATSTAVTHTDVTNGEEIYVAPNIGVEFESENHAYKCYNKYAVLKGFGIRKDFINKSRIDGAVVSRRFTCHRQGFRPNKNYINLKKFQQATRTGCLAHMTISRQPNGKFCATSFDTEHNHGFVTPCNAHMLPSQKKLSFAQAVEVNITESTLDGVPKLGMGFDSEDHAYEFYNTYAAKVGFSVRKDYVNRSKVDGAVASRRFTCFREGFRQREKRDTNVKRPRKDTRIGCLAHLIISRQPDGRYHVTHFEEKHNHELVSACRVHMLRSQKRLAATRVDDNIVDGCNVLPKKVEDFHDLDYDPVVCEYQLPFKCKREIKEEEIEKIKHYFHSKKSKNASFFYSFQLDAENQITNIFWADTKMIVDYSDFGDVVCFDTNYKFHKDSHPFAPFLGINNHRQIIIFGAALLYDESVESLNWLFHIFIEAMSGTKPKTILRDQDAIIAKAINFVLPETNQRVCVWHVYQDALKQLSHISIESDSFVNDLRSCFYNHEEEEDFVNAWTALMNMYNLWENQWLRQIYETRDQWAISFERHIFCADMQSLLVQENITSNLKKNLKNDSSVLPFLKYLGKMVNDWHYKELESNYGMSKHMPALMGDVITLKYARDSYTPKIFDLFQKEYETCLNLVLNHCSDSGSLYNYKVSIYEQSREYMVTFDSSNETISCSCMKFEFMGVLCCHALKVLDYRNIRIVPSKYILKRWTKDARV